MIVDSKAVAVIAPSLNEPNCTVPLAVTPTTPVNEPLLKEAVPSVSVVELTLVSPLIVLSKFTVIVSVALPAVLMLVPPTMLRVSPFSTVWLPPLSPATVIAVAIAAVDTPVTKPLALTVTTGIAVTLP